MPIETVPNQNAPAPTTTSWELTPDLLQVLTEIGAIAFENIEGDGWRLIRGRVYPAFRALCGGDDRAAHALYDRLESSYRAYVALPRPPGGPSVFVIP